MANETKKSKSTVKSGTTKSKKGSKKSKKSPLISIIVVIVLILGAAWYFGGKPKPIKTDEGKTKIALSEEPLINRLFKNPSDAIDEITEDIKSVTEKDAETKTSDSKKSESSAKSATSSDSSESESTAKTTTTPAVSKTSAKSASGTKGSNEKADLGHAENDPLYFGNPTDAFTDTSLATNYLMVKPQYTLSYNSQTLCPNWVAWHLDSDDMGDADRQDDFRPDPDLPSEWHAVTKSDYQYNAYGFDRGHVCPSADRTATLDDNSMTFLMTNMVPQSPDNNRVIWMHFENYERELVEQGNELYIIAGAYGTGGTSSKGTFDEIPITTKSGETYHMNVPAYSWKVCVVIPDGKDDLSRVTKDTTTIALNVPNKMGMGKTGDWEQFLVSIDYIEEQTGYDFFELLPDDIENAIEASVYSH